MGSSDDELWQAVRVAEDRCLKGDDERLHRGFQAKRQREEAEVSLSIRGALARGSAQSWDTLEDGRESPRKKSRFEPGRSFKSPCPIWWLSAPAARGPGPGASARPLARAGRRDVRRLRRLLRVRGVTAIRAQLVLRRKLFAHPGGKDESRLTLVMTPAHMGEVFCLDESPERIRSGATTPGRSTYEIQSCLHQREQLDMLQDVFLLKMKQSGKELDPRYFPKEEADEFVECDKVEWGQWAENNVLTVVSDQDRSRIPTGNIFKVPMGMACTMRGKVVHSLMQPKSRMVVRRHMDPQLGELRKDTPTIQPVAVRVAFVTATGLRWKGWVSYVTTAFLSGKETDKVVCARAPRESLPPVDGHRAVRPLELLWILKSAYGLAEAPRL